MRINKLIIKGYYEQLTHARNASSAHPFGSLQVFLFERNRHSVGKLGSSLQQQLVANVFRGRPGSSADVFRIGEVSGDDVHAAF